MKIKNIYTVLKNILANTCTGFVANTMENENPTIARKHIRMA